MALAEGVLARALTPGALKSLAAPRDAGGGSVAWTTSLEGPARDLASTSGARREDAGNALRKLAGEFSRAAARLSSDPSPRAGEAAGLAKRVSVLLLSSAAGAGGHGRVFLVGGVPVLALWWGSPTSLAALSRPGPPVAGAVPRAEPATPPGPSGPEPPFPRAAPPPGGVPPPSGARARSPAAAPRASSGAARAALAAGSAFALALFALSLSFPDIRRAAAAIPAEDPAASLDHAKEASLRSELGSLKVRYRDAVAGCRPDGPAPPVEAAPPVLPEPERADLDPPPAGYGPVALEAAASPLPPPPPPKPRAKPKPKPRPKPPPRPANDCGCGS
ncbi:MAG: hypothetical protein LBQ12_03915 [Deltaproteobacteria bacterium]|nr:hypothetical protein [Deltaproteobacteria bacterium]